jgi:16S rRNA (guanine527-N7)-methyltransferase
VTPESIGSPSLLRTVCRRNHLDLDDSQLSLLSDYVLLLHGWNKRINLISRRDENNVWTKHILSALSVLFNFQFSSPSSILDLGTGGGLPGIPLAVVLSKDHFTLIDSIQKKINAVNDILSHLKLDNVSAIGARAEELSAATSYNGKFDYVIARAVAPAKELIKWGRPFLKDCDEAMTTGPIDHKHLIPKGSIVLMKGGDVIDEIKEANIAMCPRNVEVYPITVVGDAPLDLVDKKLIIIQP